MSSCNDCHDATSVTLNTNSHAAHIDNGDLGVFGCIDCHNTTLSSDTVVNNKANHINGQADIGSCPRRLTPPARERQQRTDLAS